MVTIKEKNIEHDTWCAYETKIFIRKILSQVRMTGRRRQKYAFLFYFLNNRLRRDVNKYLGYIYSS